MECAVVEQRHPGLLLDRALDLTERNVQMGGHVPQMGRVFLPAGDHGPTVGAERHKPDLVLVTEGRTDGLTRLGSPSCVSRKRTMESSPATTTVRPSGL